MIAILSMLLGLVVAAFVDYTLCKDCKPNCCCTNNSTGRMSDAGIPKKKAPAKKRASRKTTKAKK